MHFQKQDLSEHHYNWSEPDKNPFTGQPTRRLFDRHNGDQVLFIINFVGALSDDFSIDKGRALEKRIVDELPLDMKSELSVFNWLRSTTLACSD